jgi:hypothetical protein
MMSSHSDRYYSYLHRLPVPGGGGAHQALYGAGRFGARAGLSEEEVIADLQAWLPAGTRNVPDKEIEQAVHQAYADDAKPAGRRKRQPAPAVDRRLLERLIAAGRGTTEADIIARSPVPVRDWSPSEMACGVLDALYADEEFLFIGDDGWRGELSRTIRRKSEWIQTLKTMKGCPAPKLMLNPLSGQPAPKQSGNELTLRGDACIASHRYVVVEHDNLPLADQLAFWRMAPSLPIVALVLSGKKSVHAWIRVDCADAAEWEREIEQKLFPCYLVPLGFDPSCKNESRLTRMPGHMRRETGLLQRCIYLAPEGKAVAA